jgi:hypothetical protein
MKRKGERERNESFLSHLSDKQKWKSKKISGEEKKEE